ncbi:hypothetical protein [uncultured Arcticibacterium sp.]|mgnify:CR=1 FL=1|uniref:hypothetical protein n=1 Tax=uncultured Arcticibacterium sp. TaxID=2173042 RepID=UPI0030FC07DB
MKDLNIKWLWVLGGLLLINLGLLLYLLFGNTAKKPMLERKPLLEAMLNFDEEQSIQFEALKNAHHEIITDNNKKIKVLKNRLFTDIENDEENDAAATAQRIGELTATIDLETRKHFKEVREICNEEQKQKFDDFLKEVLAGNRPMNAPNGGEHPGPPPGERPPMQGGRPPMDGMQPPPR